MKSLDRATRVRLFGLAPLRPLPWVERFIGAPLRTARRARALAPGPPLPDRPCARVLQCPHAHVICGFLVAKYKDDPRHAAYAPIWAEMQRSAADVSATERAPGLR